MISELDPSDRAEADILAPEIRICGARIRDGGSCKNPPAPGSGRCRSHGGAPGSGGPVRQHNGRYVDGHYTTERKAERRLKRRLLATAKTVETGALPSPSTSGVHLAGRVRHVKANHLQAEAPEGVHHGE